MPSPGRPQIAHFTAFDPPGSSAPLEEELARVAAEGAARLERQREKFEYALERQRIELTGSSEEVLALRRLSSHPTKHERLMLRRLHFR